MFKLIRTFLLIIFFVSNTTFVYSETSWITKKSDKTKTVAKSEKIEKKKTSQKWIKKKEIEENKIEENKNNIKKKIKESKSWITKKSKEKVKAIKEKLKNHKTIAQLPKAEFYFAAIIEPKEDEKIRYVYGYVKADKASEKFTFKNKKYFTKSDGIAYFDNKENRCEVDSQLGAIGSTMGGEVVLQCKKGLKMTGWFRQIGSIGKGDGETSEGNNVRFEFYKSKPEVIAKLEDYKSIETQIVERRLPTKKKEKILLKPNGKYYALLIGNSKYNNGWQDLTSPVSDINAIKSVLDKSYKFKKILTVENGSKKQIYNAFKELSKLTTTNDYVLIYYSGHGKIKAEQAYWIPADGSKEWGNGDWINISELDIFLTEIKAHHLAVLVDSCFVGSKFKGINIIDDISISNERLYGESLSSALNLRTRSVLSSGTTGQVSDTVAGTNHSRFALAILNMLNQFNEESYPLNLELLASLMKNYSYAGTFQKPLMYHPDTWQHGGGDFIFIPKKNLK